MMMRMAATMTSVSIFAGSLGVVIDILFDFKQIFPTGFRKKIGKIRTRHASLGLRPRHALLGLCLPHSAKEWTFRLRH